MHPSSHIKPMSNAIIVINNTHVDNPETNGFKVGAVPFSFEMASLFMKHERFLGFLLYERNESLVNPKVCHVSFSNTDSIKVSFNFNMEPAKIQKAMHQAILKLKEKSASQSHAIVYYQTDTLLMYHPPGIPCCVTHHGPFVQGFLKNYSEHEACVAFESKSKMEHLYRMQNKGIEILKKEEYFVLQHSYLQREHLLDNGINPELIKIITSPVMIKEKCSQTYLDKKISDFINVESDEVLLISTVARLDYFKNVEFLIDVAQDLLKAKAKIKVFIAGDEDEKKSRRERLEEMIPDELKSFFHISKKLTHQELFNVFHKIKNKAIFVFTSRYETLGITPIEAALSGVCTLVPDSRLVEVSNHFPETHRFPYCQQSLKKMLLSFIENKTYSDSDALMMVKNHFSHSNFESSLIDAWNYMTTSFLKQAR